MGWPGLPGNKVQQRPTGAWNWGLGDWLSWHGAEPSGETQLVGSGVSSGRVPGAPAGGPVSRDLCPPPPSGHSASAFCLPFPGLGIPVQSGSYGKQSQADSRLPTLEGNVGDLGLPFPLPLSSEPSPGRRREAPYLGWNEVGISRAGREGPYLV